MNKFKVTFEVEIDISAHEIDKIRKENRSFLTHGFFAKDLNVAKIAAYNRAVERITKGEEVNYDILPWDKTKL
jgi:hypothetical protein